MSDKDYEIVYSSDGSGKNLVSKNKESVKEIEIIPSKTTLKLRIEKGGRGGKVVTVIYEVPANKAYFEKLTKELKAKCGVGGSFKGDTIEIQGDKKDRLRELLLQKGFQVKG